MQGLSPQSVVESASVNAETASMRVVVLGASGFMGHHCAQMLADRGIDHLRVGRTPGTNVDVGLDLVRLNYPGFDAHLLRWEGGIHAEQVRRADPGQGGSSGHRARGRLRL